MMLVMIIIFNVAGVQYKDRQQTKAKQMMNQSCGATVVITSEQNLKNGTDSCMSVLDCLNYITLSAAAKQTGYSFL